MTEENKTAAILVNSFGEEYFHDVNGSVFNKIGSVALFKKHFAEEIKQENTLYIILGTDSGLLPKYIHKTGVPDGTRYIFVEIPEILERLDKVIPEEGFDGRIIFTTPEEWLKCTHENDFQHYIFLGRLIFLESVGAQDLHMATYQEYGLKLQEDLEQISWQIRAKFGNEPFFIRQLENVAENRYSAACLKGTFKGKTAIILGGGPSLDKILPWIIDHRTDLTVFAVSRITRRLIEVGLIPDIIVSVDPQQISFDISKEMLLLWEKALFVHSYHVSNKLLGQWRGRSLYLGPRFGWSTPWNNERLEGHGPTVTNTAIGLAVTMGFNRLLLAGVDLCFSREGFTHAQGSNEHQAGPRLGIGKIWVETNGGWIAETSADYHFGITTIARQAGAAEDENCQLINLSEDAAVIPGVDFHPLDNITLEHLPQSAFEMLKKHLPDDKSSSRETFLGAMVAELDRAAEAYQEIKSLSKEALKANEYFSGSRRNQMGSSKNLKKLDKIEEKLNNKYIDFTRFLKNFEIKTFIKVAYSDQDKKWNKEVVEQLMRQYYEAYRNGAKKLLGMIQSARDRLLSRLEEEKDCPDFDLLIGQWKKDVQPGRSLVWRTRHRDPNIPDVFLPHFHSLEKDFKAVMEKTETLHMAKIRVSSDLSRVLGKLNLLFKSGEQDRIKHLLGGLQKIEGEEAKILFHLGNGFLSELEGNVDAALKAYQFVIDQLLEKQSGSALESALLRVFSISLAQRHTENALLAANCLAGISPAYLPYYADILRIADDKVGALDVYTEYLERVSADISIMLKMGQLYFELGIMDGAKLMFESVLKEDPGNEAALQLLSNLDR